MLTAVEAPVRISVASVEPDNGRWLITWHVTNLTRGELTLDDAWLPHGRFRGEGHRSLDLAIAPEGTSRVQLRVHSHEAPGTVVNNAFLILRLNNRWRVFARMRVEFDAMPRPIVEAVTVQSLQSSR